MPLSKIDSDSLNTAAVAQTNLATNVAGNGPAFGAYQSSATALTANAWTKITFDTEEFDTNSNFASSRFTPTVAGYYQINASTYITSTGLMATAFYKNGSLFKQGTQVNASVQGIQTSSLLYMNGSTDYIEFYVYQTATQNTSTGQSLTWFSGYLARSA